MQFFVSHFYGFFLKLSDSLCFGFDIKKPGLLLVFLFFFLFLFLFSFLPFIWGVLFILHSFLWFGRMVGILGSRRFSFFIIEWSWWWSLSLSLSLIRVIPNLLWFRFIFKLTWDFFLLLKTKKIVDNPFLLPSAFCFPPLQLTLFFCFYTCSFSFLFFDS